MGCTNRSVKGCGLRFYRFPADLDRRARWVSAINRKNWQPTEHSWLCSSHFISGAKCNDPLSPDFVPSVFAHTSSPQKGKRINDLQSYKRRKRVCASRREATRQETTASLLQLSAKASHADALTSSKSSVNDLCTEAPLQGCDQPLDTQTNDVGTQTVSSQMMDVGTETDVSFLSLERECYALREEKHELYRTIESFLMSIESFESDKKRLKFYTGLDSIHAVKAIFNLIAPAIEDHHLSSLSKFNQFLMVLMKLRLNLTDQDLGYRFGISQCTVSKIWMKVINIMYVRLKSFIMWPEREQLQKTMPLTFRDNFSKCVCIIDCFEIFCERPRDLMARAQTYSHYKHHNTVKLVFRHKVLYISKGWGGRVSDKYLTENCGLLNCILPGDQILADRGFNVQESVGFYCAEIKIPPFTKGKKQLSQIEVDTARQLSHVRIHVERVIGLLRNKYTILQSTLPIKMIMCNDGENSVLDKIVVICSVLCNCCQSVIPFD